MTNERESTAQALARHGTKMLEEAVLAVLQDGNGPLAAWEISLHTGMFRNDNDGQRSHALSRGILDKMTHDGTLAWWRPHGRCPNGKSPEGVSKTGLASTTRHGE